MRGRNVCPDISRLKFPYAYNEIKEQNCKREISFSKSNHIHGLKLIVNGLHRGPSQFLRIK